MNAQHSTYTGPVNVLCTGLAKVLVPGLMALAEWNDARKVFSEKGVQAPPAVV